MTKHLSTKSVHIVFDTSLIFTRAENKLICLDLKNLIKETNDTTELEISWYLPSIVIAERKYRMLQRSKALLEHIQKIEKILGYSLKVTDTILEEKIDDTIQREIAENNLSKLDLDKSSLNLDTLINSSTNRLPPFEEKTEKGFRDYLILESYYQLTRKMPDLSSSCRLIFVTNDSVLQQAFSVKMQGRANAELFSNLDLLKSHINILNSTIKEEIIKNILPIAASIFFVPDDKSTLYFKEEISKKISEKYSQKISNGPTPKEPSFEWQVDLTGILVRNPTFLSKNKQKTQWSNKIIFKVEASKSTISPPYSSSYLSSLNATQSTLADIIPPGIGLLGSSVHSALSLARLSQSTLQGGTYASTSSSIPSQEEKQKGEHYFEVIWETTLTSDSNLINPEIIDIKYIDTQWEQTPRTKLFEGLLSYLENK